MSGKRICDDCGQATSFRRTRCHACNKMVCPGCWALGFNCPYPAENQRKTALVGGLYITRKPHRSNIKV